MLPIGLKVSSASRLIPSHMNGLSDPYCCITVGEETFKTRPMMGTCAPEWNETVTMSGKTVADAGGIVAFEVRYGRLE